MRDATWWRQTPTSSTTHGQIHAAAFPHTHCVLFAHQTHQFLRRCKRGAATARRRRRRLIRRVQARPRRGRGSRGRPFERHDERGEIARARQRGVDFMDVHQLQSCDALSSRRTTRLWATMCASSGSTWCHSYMREKHTRQKTSDKSSNHHDDWR